MSALAAYRVEQVAPERTYPLHQAVLRPWLTVEEVATTPPGLATFAALSIPEESVLSCATLYRDAAPEAVPASVREERKGYRLRSMATAEGYRGEGIGGAVLAAVLDEVAHLGGGLLWCHAREKAVPFYEQMGLVVAGEPFAMERIGVHLVMWRVVERSAPVAE